MPRYRVEVPLLIDSILHLPGAVLEFSSEQEDGPAWTRLDKASKTKGKAAEVEAPADVPAVAPADTPADLA